MRIWASPDRTGGQSAGNKVAGGAGEAPSHIVARKTQPFIDPAKGCSTDGLLVTTYAMPAVRYVVQVSMLNIRMLCTNLLPGSKTVSFCCNAEVPVRC